MQADHTAAVATILPFLGACLAPLLVAAFRRHAGYVLALVPLAVLALMAGHLGTVSGGGVITERLDWIPSLGIALSFRIDGLSLVFALLISGIGALVLAYAGAYLDKDPALGRFLAFLMMFMGSMLGLVLADDLIALFVFWELTSITSFLLIGHHHGEAASRRAALQALVITGGGGLVMLAGFVLVMAATGQSSLSGLLAAGAIDTAGLALPVGLIIIGAFAKSAQVPFNVWLPNAMQAPTPVSAYLHSATMVKAGVYLLMRLDPVFGDMALWQAVLPVFGAATLLVGAVLAVGQSDLKLILAQTTVASLGLMVMLTGLPGAAAAKAAVLYLVAHALFKGALFMVAGVIDHEAGSRDVARLSGLGRAMPLTFAAGLLAALSMAGLPFFAGFTAKEEIYIALFSGPSPELALLAVAIFGNALMVSAALQVGLTPFVGARIEPPKPAHDGPPGLMAGPLLLALAGLAAGLLPFLVQPLFTAPMASAVIGAHVVIDLPVLPHWGPALGLSVLTLLAGLSVWRWRRPVRATVTLVRETIGWGPDRGFDQLMSWLIGFSHGLNRLIQPGRLEIYLTVTFLVIGAALIAVPLAAGEWSGLPKDWPSAFMAMTLSEAVFIAITALGLVAVLVARTRLTAIVSLGIQGFGVALIYLVHGAPDLAFTQFMVETLSVVILALVMTRLRLEPSDHRPRLSMIGDGLIALATGAGFAALLLTVTAVPFDRSLSDFFSLHSKLVAHGANVVNVIIVDFRGLDTLGEIAVVAITGLAILALVRIGVRQKTER